MPIFLGPILRALAITLISVISTIAVNEVNNYFGDEHFPGDDFLNR